MTTLRIVDHATTPGGRYVRDGEYSGEWFREEVLKPALMEASKSGDKLTVVLDGVSGYGSSFLEEAFGGLIRKEHFTRQELDRLLAVTAESGLYRYYADLARKYIQNAQSERVPA